MPISRNVSESDYIGIFLFSGFVISLNFIICCIFQCISPFFSFHKVFQVVGLSIIHEIHKNKIY